MTPETLLDDLSDRGVIVTALGDDIKLRGPIAAITDVDVSQLRASKPDVLRLLRLQAGLPADDEADAGLDMVELDPSEVPACASCGRLCDVQSLDDRWHCTPCDPLAEQRRQRTERLLRTSAAIRYTGKCDG